MSRSRDPFQIPRTGLEIAPTAALTSIDLNGQEGALSGQEFVGEHAFGGTLVYAIYQALLAGLRTEALRRRGEIDRQLQIRVVAATVWEATKKGAAMSVVLSLVLLVCPWLTVPLTLLGFVGMGKASLDLFHAFWDGLSPEQQQELSQAAHEAGVNLARFLNGGAAPQQA